MGICFQCEIHGSAVTRHLVSGLHGIAAGVGVKSCRTPTCKFGGVIPRWKRGERLFVSQGYQHRNQTTPAFHLRSFTLALSYFLLVLLHSFLALVVVCLLLNLNLAHLQDLSACMKRLVERFGLREEKYRVRNFERLCMSSTHYSIFAASSDSQELCSFIEHLGT